MHNRILLTHHTSQSRCTPPGPSCSHLITHNSPCCSVSLSNLRSCSSQYSSSLTFRNIGWKMMEPCVLMNPIVGNQRKQLHGCVREASIRSPTPSKQILATLCTMDPLGMCVMNLLLRPLAGLYSTRAVEHPTIHHLDFELLPMSRRLNREYEPMSRRLNRECPCEARGYIASGPTSNLPQLL